MTRYMLDTDTCSYIMKRSSEAIIKRLRTVPVTDVCISVVTNDIAEFNRVKGLTLENWTTRPVRRARSTGDT